jgi:hypothetical protein
MMGFGKHDTVSSNVLESQGLPFGLINEDIGLYLLPNADKGSYFLCLLKQGDAFSQSIEVSPEFFEAYLKEIDQRPRPEGSFCNRSGHRCFFAHCHLQRKDSWFCFKYKKDLRSGDVVTTTYPALHLAFKCDDCLQRDG